MTKAELIRSHKLAINAHAVACRHMARTGRDTELALHRELLAAALVRLAETQALP